MLALQPLASSSLFQGRFAWLDEGLTFVSTSRPNHFFVSTHGKKKLRDKLRTEKQASRMRGVSIKISKKDWLDYWS